MTKMQMRILTDLSQSIRQRAERAATTEGERLLLYGWLDRLAAVLGPPRCDFTPRAATAADRARISPTGQRIKIQKVQRRTSARRSA